MRKNDKKLFLEKELLYQAVNLRLIGWAYTSIAIVFNCDRSSVASQCEKYGILPLGERVYTLESIVDKVINTLNEEERKWETFNGQRFRVGLKKYSDYLR